MTMGHVDAVAGSPFARVRRNHARSGSRRLSTAGCQGRRVLLDALNESNQLSACEADAATDPGLGLLELQLGDSVAQEADLKYSSL